MSIQMITKYNKMQMQINSETYTFKQMAVPCTYVCISTKYRATKGFK